MAQKFTGTLERYFAYEWEESFPVAALNKLERSTHGLWCDLCLSASLQES
jgi:hypothetical protein